VQHGKRADAIVKNMLLHSREGSGEHRPVDVNALVEESLNLAYHGARAEKQGFKINMERSLDPACALPPGRHDWRVKQAHHWCPPDVRSRKVVASSTASSHA
jgi:hypothetical protein